MAGINAQPAPPKIPAIQPAKSATAAGAPLRAKTVAVAVTAPIASWPSEPTGKMPARNAGATPSATMAIGIACTIVSATAY